MKAILNLVLVLSLVSCSPDKVPTYNQILTTGNLRKNGYSNDYFKFKITIPRNWLVLNKEEIEERNRMGLELISESVDISDTTSNKQPKFLININKYRQDAQEALQGNAGFQISFLKKQYFPNETELSFITKARKLLVSVPYYKNTSEIDIVEIGGKNFRTFISEVHFKGYIVTQQSYVLDLNDCFLLIDISYRGDFVKPELDRIISSLRFY